MRPARALAGGALLAIALALAGAAPAGAHGVGAGDAGFVAGNDGLAVGPYLYLGAKHMVTGYDHLLFLVGVVFFLYRVRDVAVYVSLFTLGHSATLLLGVLGGIEADAHLVDAVIGVQPSTKAAVVAFGLVHGFGLATKVQELAPSRDGLVGNMLAFNVGVELGQVAALGLVVLGLDAWRRHPSYLGHAFLTNVLLMAAGFLLVGHQLAGFFLGT